MRITKYMVSLLTLVLFFSVNLLAQNQYEEMTEEEWQSEINRLTEKKAALQSELNGLQEDVNNMKAEMANMQTYEYCMDEVNQMVDANDSDIDAFRKKVQNLEGLINRKTPEKENRQAELDALKANKISALPEFYNTVHVELQRKLDAWVVAPKEVMYTVVRGDHLWGIAKKSEHYGNGFAWPKIYNANKDKIKDPDLIYPKQIFKIPNLSDEEKAYWDKVRKNYKPAPETN